MAKLSENNLEVCFDNEWAMIKLLKGNIIITVIKIGRLYLVKTEKNLPILFLA